MIQLPRKSRSHEPRGPPATESPGSPWATRQTGGRLQPCAAGIMKLIIKNYSVMHCTISIKNRKSCLQETQTKIQKYKSFIKCRNKMFEWMLNWYLYSSIRKLNQLIVANLRNSIVAKDSLEHRNGTPHDDVVTDVLHDGCCLPCHEGQQHRRLVQVPADTSRIISKSCYI